MHVGICCWLCKLSHLNCMIGSLYYQSSFCSDNSLLLVSSPVLRSCRFALVMMGFYAAMCLFLLRVNMSVAIICMTNDDEDNNGTLVPVNDCPRQLDKEEDDQVTY